MMMIVLLLVTHTAFQQQFELVASLSVTGQSSWHTEHSEAVYMLLQSLPTLRNVPWPPVLIDAFL